MAIPAISLSPLAASAVLVGGTAAVAIYGPVAGGSITNPLLASDQNILTAEVLYVDISGAAAVLAETSTCVPIQPGQTFKVPIGLTTNVSVNAKTSGHKFSGFVLQSPTPFPPTPQSGTFPPSGPTTLTLTLPSYLYQEYADDDNLQAFVAAYNELTQIYVSWFATGLLPVYTSDTITGALLDWVAQGLYGIIRPALGSGENHTIGPFNTLTYNSLAYNKRKLIGPADVTVVSDDVFKRIITWNFYKGDGNRFNIRWIKRRVVRFLIGEDGSAPNIDQTYDVSVTTGPGIINIALSIGTRSITGGALYNRFGYNRRAYNGLSTQFVPGPPTYPLASVFKEAMDAGVLQMPLQSQVVVSI
jgi:hypothetical protein